MTKHCNSKENRTVNLDNSLPHIYQKRHTHWIFMLAFLCRCREEMFSLNDMHAELLLSCIVYIYTPYALFGILSIHLKTTGTYLENNVMNVHRRQLFNSFHYRGFSFTNKNLVNPISNGFHIYMFYKRPSL